MTKRLIASSFFTLVTYVFVFFNRGNKVIVLDIDNTLADTYVSLKRKEKMSRRDRLLGLDKKKAVIDYINDSFTDYKVFFLSARSNRDFWVTIKWLRSVGYKISFMNLVLVSRPKQKLRYLKILCKRNHLIYVDDLSYNHENGQVKFYTDVIEEVLHLNIKYIGYSDIELIEKLKNNE